MHATSEKHRGYGPLARSSRHTTSIVVLGVLAALAVAAVGAYAVRGPARVAAGFSVTASPTRQTVVRGSIAKYRIRLNRRGFTGAIKLSVSGVPRNAQPRLSSAPGALRTLAVTTGDATATGRYTLVLRARGPGAVRSVRLLLVVLTPKPVAVGISGAVSGLQPGTPQTLDLTLRNPNGITVWVRALTVTATGVSAPRSTPALPCTLSDFSMRQFSGPYPLVVPASSTRTLSALGVPASQRPQVMLLDRSLNQDGCQGAMVTLAYSAVGTAR